MKILIIIDSLGSGGAERSTAVMADYLACEKVQFSILCLDRKTIGVQKLLQDRGYEISFLENSSFYSQSREIAKIIDTGNYCVVHSILFRSNLRTRFARAKVKFTHLESLVNTTYSAARFNDKRVNSKVLALYKLIDKISANRLVDHFHSITHTVKDHYIEELGIDPSKFTVIYRGRKSLGKKNMHTCEKRVPRLINVGRHEFQKGQLYLLQAAKLLKDEGYSFTLDIYGREGNQTNALKSFISDNNLKDIISLRGFSHEVPKELLTSDIFIFPSLYEGLGGALIEAQSAGLPIACNDIPVLREVVVENENALFFKVEEVESIASTLKFFLDNPEKRKCFGIKSLENFNKKFQESENNARMLKLYKDLC